MPERNADNGRKPFRRNTTPTTPTAGAETPAAQTDAPADRRPERVSQSDDLAGTGARSGDRTGPRDAERVSRSDESASRNRSEDDRRGDAGARRGGANTGRGYESNRGNVNRPRADAERGARGDKYPPRDGGFRRGGAHGRGDAPSRPDSDNPRRGYEPGRGETRGDTSGARDRNARRGDNSGHDSEKVRRADDAGRGRETARGDYGRSGASSRGGYTRGRRGDENPRGSEHGRSDRAEPRAGTRPDRRAGGRPGDSGARRDTARRGGDARRVEEPDLPDDILAADLEPTARRDLLSLDKGNAETVARHLVMASRLVDDDPRLALAHARAARQRAGRIAVVRETAGIIAYHAGEWAEALAELRAARRMSGGPGLLAVMADCERGLGRPEKAIELGRSEEALHLTGDDATELRIVVAGARMDMHQYDQAVVTLQTKELDPARTGPSAARLFYAYADALVAAGRTDEGRTWFLNAAAADLDDDTDAEERAAELSG